MQTLLSACASLPAPTPIATPVTTDVSLPESVADHPEAALPALILAERAATTTGDLPVLEELWTVDARVVDGRGTADPTDDYIWQGRDAILDRYELAVLPAPPLAMDASQLQGIRITIDQDIATAEIGIDRWTAIWRDGRWRLQELHYN